VPKHQATGCSEYVNRRPKPASREAGLCRVNKVTLDFRGYIEFSVCSIVSKLGSCRKQNFIILSNVL